MARIKFREIRMSKANKERLELINDIIEEYQGEGYVLTLRQLYYQLVSRDIVPNKQAEYSKLSTLLKEGRMAGVVDWDAIEDRLRKPSQPASWDSPKDIMDAVATQFALPRQQGQNTYVEVWVEKDALSGVLKRVTEKYHIPILVNRGYSSASSMFDSYNRFRRAVRKDQNVRVLYLGDHDPSGQDMIRDIYDRTMEFFNGAGYDYVDFEIELIALTTEQVRQYGPPPNPAKITDPRAAEYISKHGPTSWEVDALKPEVLNRLLDDAIQGHIDLDVYEGVVSQEQAHKDRLRELKEML